MDVGSDLLAFEIGRRQILEGQTVDSGTRGDEVGSKFRQWLAALNVAEIDDETWGRSSGSLKTEAGQWTGKPSDC